MAVLIRSERVERKIRELAQRTGWGLTESVERAVDRELATLPPQTGRISRESIQRVQAEVAARSKARKGKPDSD